MSIFDLNEYVEDLSNILFENKELLTDDIYKQVIENCGLMKSIIDSYMFEFEYFRIKVVMIPSVGENDPFRQDQDEESGFCSNRILHKRMKRLVKVVNKSTYSLNEIIESLDQIQTHLKFHLEKTDNGEIFSKRLVIYNRKGLSVIGVHERIYNMYGERNASMAWDDILPISLKKKA